MGLIGIDFFSGCGGTSFGFQKAGINVLYGIDFDPACKETYEYNVKGSEFLCRDISKLEVKELDKLKSLRKKNRLLISGCAPCQPFSKHSQKDLKDDRRSLLNVFAEKIEKILPDYIFIENVPGLQSTKGNDVFKAFTNKLTELGYKYRHDIINCADYGVPQNRKRLILLASLHGEIDFPKYTHSKENYRTVRDAIFKYSKIEAGEQCLKFNSHMTRKMSEANLERLKFTPKDGGSRLNWPKRLWLDCHKKSKGHTDIYGRMYWDRPAPTITCKCTSISNGRFGHPVQNRAISVREAAALQTFPDTFKIFGKIDDASRLVGNAVPVRLSYIFGKHFLRIDEKS